MENPTRAVSLAGVAAEAAHAVAPPTQGNNNSARSTADRKRTYQLSTRFVEEVLSHEYKPSRRIDDDDDSKYKEKWNEAVDLFNQLKEELMVDQAKLRDEYITNGYVEVDDDFCDEVARRSKAIHDLDAFVEKLCRDEEEEEEESNRGCAGEV